MEISRARNRVELVTDDAARLRGQLEVATGERISALSWISHQLKHPNEVGRLNRLSFNKLPNGRMLSKLQHCVPHGSVTGRDGDRPLRRKNACLPVGVFPRTRPKNRPLRVFAIFNATKPPMASPSLTQTRDHHLGEKSRLEGIGVTAQKSATRDRAGGLGREAIPDTPVEAPEGAREPEQAKTREPKRIEHDLGL